MEVWFDVITSYHISIRRLVHNVIMYTNYSNSISLLCICNTTVDLRLPYGLLYTVNSLIVVLAFLGTKRVCFLLHHAPKEG